MTTRMRLSWRRGILDFGFWISDLGFWILDPSIKHARQSRLSYLSLSLLQQNTYHITLLPFYLPYIYPSSYHPVNKQAPLFL